MRQISFGDFWQKGNLSGFGERLYVLLNGTECLYVGISRGLIWERWFDPYRGHIRGKHSCSNTSIGDHVIQNLPASLGWTLELWTEEDCRAMAGDKAHLRLEDCEAMVIRKLEPVFNVIHNASDRYHPVSDDIADMYENLGG